MTPHRTATRSVAVGWGKPRGGRRGKGFTKERRVLRNLYLKFRPRRNFKRSARAKILPLIIFRKIYRKLARNNRNRFFRLRVKFILPRLHDPYGLFPRVRMDGQGFHLPIKIFINFHHFSLLVDRPDSSTDRPDLPAVI